MALNVCRDNDERSFSGTKKTKPTKSKQSFSFVLVKKMFCVFNFDKIDFFLESHILISLVKLILNEHLFQEVWHWKSASFLCPRTNVSILIQFSTCKNFSKFNQSSNSLFSSLRPKRRKAKKTDFFHFNFFLQCKWATQTPFFCFSAATTNCHLIFSVSIVKSLDRPFQMSRRAEENFLSKNVIKIAATNFAPLNKSLYVCVCVLSRWFDERCFDDSVKCKPISNNRPIFFPFRSRSSTSLNSFFMFRFSNVL